MNPGSQAPRQRMLGIDAARGAAMFFSCLAHFGWWIEPSYPRAEHLLTTLGMIATPTFLLLSGTVTGWLCATASTRSEDTRLKLLNRGLFLLTFGHLFISLTEWYRHGGGLLPTLAGATIIDDIGLCMVGCALWFPALQRRDIRHALVRYAIAGYVLCSLVVVAWHPPAGGWLALRQALFDVDPLGKSMHSYASPVLPYMCLFAIGLGLSDRMVAASQAGAHDRRRRLIIAGLLMVAIAVSLRGVRWLLDSHFPADTLRSAIDWYLTIGGKLPPAPSYVLAYLGAGFVISALLFALATRHATLPRLVVAAAATVGRASFFVFVVQYFIYWTLPDLVGIAPSTGHPVLIFCAGLGLNWLAAWGWNRIRGNRFLTLGIGRIWRARESGKPKHTAANLRSH